MPDLGIPGAAVMAFSLFLDSIIQVVPPIGAAKAPAGTASQVATNTQSSQIRRIIVELSIDFAVVRNGPPK